MLKEGENLLGKWAIKYFPPEGGKYLGSLIITDSKIMFINKNESDESNTGLCIKKSEISSVRTRNNLITNEIIISVNGKTHSFSKPFLKTNVLVNFIKR